MHKLVAAVSASQEIVKATQATLKTSQAAVKASQDATETTQEAVTAAQDRVAALEHEFVTRFNGLELQMIELQKNLAEDVTTLYKQQSRRMSRLSAWATAGAMSDTLAGLVGNANRARCPLVQRLDVELFRIATSCTVLVTDLVRLYYDGLIP